MKSLRLLLLPFALVTSLRAELSAEAQHHIDARIQEIQQWASSPEIVHAVAEQNSHPSDEVSKMSNEAWKQLTLLDKFVRSFSKNPTALALKAHAADWVSEAFLNDAEGRKVAFLAKTSSWSHASAAKHTTPMSGHTWQGAVEVDESSGAQQVQVSVPVMDGGHVIGSLVVGIRVANL